jgi:hypothetical protein
MNIENSYSHVFREAIVPQPTEKKGNEGWVKWGKDNLYPQFLNRLFYQSAIHGGIINSKIKYISGSGLNYDGLQLAKWEQILNNGRSKYTLDEVVTNMCQDLEIFNSFYLRCIKDITTGLWYFETLDTELMRNSLDGMYFYYSENWKTNQQGDKTKFKKYKSIEYLDATDFECVLYVSTKAKQYLLDDGTLTMNSYPVPNYSGAITSIMGDIEMDSFHYSESVNNFAGGTIIKLNNGLPTPDERREIESNIKESTTDRTKKGGITVLYADGKEREASIENINGNDLDKRYIETQKHNAESIMIAHGVINPALFSVKTAGQLGGQQELEMSFLLFKENYIVSRQKTILDAINWLNEKLNQFDEVFFNDFELKLTNEVKPIEAPAQFKTEDKILEKLSKCGVPRSELNFVKSFDISDFDNLESAEFEAISLCKIERFVSAENKKILDLINQGVRYNDISKEVRNLTPKLLSLKDGGFLDNDYKLTDLGKSEIQAVEFRVFYTYEKRPDAPDLKGESREFCQVMLERDLAYTRNEIDQISNDEGTSVWLYRGGWYNNPDTGKNQPSCRHYWKMNVTTN